MADDTNEIQVAAEHFLRALDNLDWERFVACWSSDPSAFYPGDDTRVDGRAAVLTRFRTMFEEIPLRASGPPYLNLKPRNLPRWCASQRSARLPPAILHRDIP